MIVYVVRITIQAVKGTQTVDISTVIEQIHTNMSGIRCARGKGLSHRPCKKTQYGMDPACLIECKGGDNRCYATTQCGIFAWCYYGRKFTYNCPAGTVFDKKRGS